MPLFGVDVSEHQDVVDWPKVAASGITFAVLKAKEGTTYTDPRYAANLHGARTAGIPVIGAYHFLVNTSSPVTQADGFCALAPPDGIHALDVEAPGPLDPRAWVDRYREHYPHHPLLVYTGKYLWSQRAKVAYNGAGFGPLWVAGAVPGAYVPGADESPAHSWSRVGSQDGGVPFWGWTDWTLMQHSESCRVPGISTRVDANAYRGSVDELRALTVTGDHPKPPQPPHPPARSTVYGPLQYGDRGPSVKLIQGFLGVTADGDFGRHTKIAVENWQSRRHLTVDGIVGINTARRMGFDYATK